MRRIVILGCAGAGKMTLAQRLAKQMGAPLISLDAIWRPACAAETTHFRNLVRDAHQGEAWISEGNFAAATFDLRLSRADLIVWLEAPQSLCLYRVVRRTFRSDEPHRPGDLAKVITFIRQFDRINRPRIEELRLVHGPNVPVRRLGLRAEVEQFISEVASARL